VTEGLADHLGELLRLLDGSDVEELEVEHEGVRFLVRREAADGAAVVQTTVVAAAALAEPAEPVPLDDSFVIASPLVGVFRRSTGRSTDAVLDEGDTVTVGQVVGAVEAMGMLNRVQSERAGIVQEVLVREGQPVEYGQPLLVVREP
jgi:acetyl-CoA carboxylase biotin carboxyl carrier protein